VHPPPHNEHREAVGGREPADQGRRKGIYQYNRQYTGGIGLKQPF